VGVKAGKLKQKNEIWLSHVASQERTLTVQNRVRKNRREQGSRKERATKTDSQILKILEMQPLPLNSMKTQIFTIREDL